MAIEIILSSFEITKAARINALDGIIEIYGWHSFLRAHLQAG
jgi:hypothetical protein